MNSARWREIRALFDELADASAEARAARLVALGSADPELRRDVERLLESDADAERRLAQMLTPAEPVRDPLGLGGRTLSHFRVGAPLGSGGMGVVYAAEDTRLGRMVALKVPLPERHPDASGRRRFLQEARSAGSLDHPNVCSIHEVGETEDGLLFLAMPLYRGETLRARLEREGALPADRAIDIARQVARGVAAAHAAGFVHRDLKPANVMLLPDGLVKVLDFGLAKAREQSLSVTGAMLGTAAYMAPEQIRSEPVNARTDLWALGVVLYEMVTGRKPFSGEHDASLAHAIVHDEPASPAAIASGLPNGLEAVILELLAKDPAHRPATAEEVEARLAAVAAGRPPVAVSSERRPRSRALAGAAVIGAALLGAVALARRSDRPAGPADAGLVAIAPFDAADPELQLWREGLADVLARDLDGAGPLRTVPPSVALQRWAGRADRPSADALGARTGAGIVIFGNVVRRGADSVGIRATVLDRARGIADSDIEVAGEERRMGELADSLGVRILRLLGRSRPIASARHVSIGARSLPALKEFLQGEQFYRRGQIDSALAHYDRAIAEDSTFALALRRMGWVLGNGAPTTSRYAPQADYMRRAVRFNRGLSPRDSVLLLADSLGRFAADSRTPDEMIASIYRVKQSLEDLARRYSDDPSVWYELGEMRTHFPPPVGGRSGSALEAYDRAIALDSGFAPAYMHTIRHAIQLGLPERARAYARAYVARGLPGQPGDLHLMQAIFDSGGVNAPAVRQRIDTALASSLHWVAYEHLRFATDSAETSVRLLRAIRSGRHRFEGAAEFVSDTLLREQQLAMALAYRGHLREAAAVDARLLADVDATRLGFQGDPFVDLALLRAIDDSLAARTFGAALRPGADWADGGSRGSRANPPRALGGLPWWFARGDSASLRLAVGRAAEVLRADGPPLAELRARYFGSAAGAWLALLRGDSAGATRLFEAIPDTLCVVASCHFEKLALARLVAARGDDRRAATILDEWAPATYARPALVLFALERARVAERLGDRTTAARQYRFVIDAWRRPDPELVPYAEEARAGLGRVASADRR